MGQCAVGADDYRTYQETLNEFSGNTTTITHATQNDNISLSSGQMLLIPDGQTFTGNIEGNNHTNVLICIAQGGDLNHGSMNNFNGTIRNYNTGNSFTINSDYKGNLENYGGTIHVNSTSQIETGRYIINASGTINWNNALNVSNGNIYNEGMILVSGQMSGNGCIHNEGWISVGSYFGHNNITNNGKIEIIGTAMSFNGGTVINNCAMFSGAEGAQFQNNTSITNNGLIYLPIGNFENKAGYTFTNGSTGVIRTRDFTNEGLFTGSGKVYVTGNSRNVNQGVFGQGTDDINFYDASPGGVTGYFDEVHNPANIGPSVVFTAFPEPEYSPDLSEYQCGDIILAGSVDPGEIAASQILCLGINPEPFTSVEDASVSDNGATITYQWQSSTDNVNFYNISGATSTTYTVESRPNNETYYRRRARATYAGADSVKNARNSSNVLVLIPVDEPAASITLQPSSTEVCSGQATQFTAAAENHDSYLWQLSFDGGNHWNNLSETAPYSGVSSGALSISEVSIGMDNYRYRLSAIHNQCGTVYSNPATLSVKPDDTPLITEQPSNQIICHDGTQAVFTVDASSPTESEIAYQWQVNTGSGWGDITNGSNYSGVHTATLTVGNNGLENEAQFRCVLQAECDNTTTNAATLYMVVPQLVVSSTPEIKCPDTEVELGFNGLDSDYRMGNSRVVFMVNRISNGPFNWQFTYNLSLSNPELLAAYPPQSTMQTIDVEESDDEYMLVFYLENQTQDVVELTIELSDVSIEGCTESSENNSNHITSTTVRRMPVVGAFNAY